MFKPAAPPLAASRRGGFLATCSLTIIALVYFALSYLPLTSRGRDETWIRAVPTLNLATDLSPAPRAEFLAATAPVEHDLPVLLRSALPPISKPARQKAANAYRIDAQEYHFGNLSCPETLHVAWCDYSATRQWFHSRQWQEFLVHWFVPHLWPSKHVVARRVYAKVSHLPPEVDPGTPAGLRLLGITDAHLRICYFGNTELIAHMLTLPGVALGDVSAREAQLRLAAAGMLGNASRAGDKWTHAGRVAWPVASDRIALLVNLTTGLPFGPLLFRRSQESFGSGVRGVPVQIETMLENIAQDLVTIYLPFVVDSFAWRWKSPYHAADDKGVWETKMGSGFDNLKDTVTRPGTYQPNLAPRQHFMASLVSHCEGNPAIPVREAFTYAVHAALKKPVHNVGVCPEGEDGARLAGLDVSQRVAVQRAFRGASAVQVFSKFKFAVVFENSFLAGYFTEKLINAYLAEAVPVYYAERYEDLVRVVNPKAFIYCELPRAKTKQSYLLAVRQRTCAALALDAESANCSRATRVELRDKLKPYFDACARKIDAMDRDDALYERTLREPLAVLDERGELSEMWSGKVMGALFRAMLVALGYVRI